MFDMSINNENICEQLHYKFLFWSITRMTFICKTKKKTHLRVTTKIFTFTLHGYMLIKRYVVTKSEV